MHHLGRLSKAGGAIDHAEHLYDLLDPREVAEDGLRGRELSDGAGARGLVALFNRIGVANTAFPGRAVLWWRGRSGEVKEIAGNLPDRHGRHGHCRLGQLDAELLELLFWRHLDAPFANRARFPPDRSVRLQHTVLCARLLPYGRWATHDSKLRC